MGFLLEKCTLYEFDNTILNNCIAFGCDNPDLNEFFSKDVLDYREALLGKSYCFTLDENPKIIVCAFTVSNDSIKANFLPNARGKKIKSYT
ncbi:MAG: hypothetical protein ACK5UE_09095 [Chitinophagales bacterium]|nr:hypothetical protein [Sphingobacteriales bacterium]